MCTLESVTLECRNKSAQRKVLILTTFQNVPDIPVPFFFFLILLLSQVVLLTWWAVFRDSFYYIMSVIALIAVSWNDLSSSAE